MVTKEEFVKRFAQKGYTKKASGVIYDDFLSLVLEALGNGETISFRGFGSFEVKERAARETVLPSNGKRYKIPPYNVVKFTPSKNLKRLIKTGYEEKTS